MNSLLQKIGSKFSNIFKSQNDVIDLCNAELEDEGLALLCDWLMTVSSVKFLKLVNNNITDKSFNFLAELLRTNRSI